MHFFFIKGNVTPSLIQITHIYNHRIWETEFDSIYSEVNLIKKLFKFYPLFTYSHTFGVDDLNANWKRQYNMWIKIFPILLMIFFLLTFCDPNTKGGFDNVFHLHIIQIIISLKLTSLHGVFYCAWNDALLPPQHTSTDIIPLSAEYGWTASLHLQWLKYLCPYKE